MLRDALENPCHAQRTKRAPAQELRMRLVAKSYHDSSVTPLPPLVPEQSIRIKTHPQQAHSNCKPRIIVNRVALVATKLKLMATSIAEVDSTCARHH